MLSLSARHSKQNHISNNWNKRLIKYSIKLSRCLTSAFWEKGILPKTLKSIAILLVLTFHGWSQASDLSDLPENIQAKINELVGLQQTEKENKPATSNLTGDNEKESSANRPIPRPVTMETENGTKITQMPDGRTIYQGKKNGDEAILFPNGQLIYKGKDQDIPINITNFKKPPAIDRIDAPPARKPPEGSLPINNRTIDYSKLPALGQKIETNNPTLGTGSNRPIRIGGPEYGTTSSGPSSDFGWESMIKRSSIGTHNTEPLPDGPSPFGLDRFMQPATYKQPILGTPDPLKASSYNPQLGIGTYVRESGQVSLRLENGQSIDIYPNRNSVRITNPDGREEIVKADESGLINFASKTQGGRELEFAIDPTNGRSMVQEKQNGQNQNGKDNNNRQDNSVESKNLVTRAIINADGSSLLQDQNGNKMTTDQKGKIIEFECTIGESKFKYDGKTETLMAKDKNDNLQAIKGKYDNDFREIDSNKPVEMSALIGKAMEEFKNQRSSIAGEAKKSILPQQYNETKVDRVPIQNIKPSLNQKMEMALAMIKANADMMNSRFDSMEKVLNEIRRLKENEKKDEDAKKELAEKEKKLRDEVEKEIARRTFEKEEDAIKKKLDAAEKNLEKERGQVEREKSKIDAMINQASIQRDRIMRNVSTRNNDLSLMRITNNKPFERARLQEEEKRLNDLLQKALAEIEKLKPRYDRCPMKQKWDDCGHSDLKKKWINDMLLMILGPKALNDLKELGKKKAEIEKADMDLKEKERETERMNGRDKEKIQELDESIASYRKDKQSIGDRLKPMEQSVSEIKKELNRFYNRRKLLTSVSP